MLAINAARDLRNNVVCAALDVKTFASSHPIATLSSLGIAPFVYASIQWQHRVIEWIASFSPFSASLHQHGPALLATSIKTNVPSLTSRWSWNPIHSLPLSLQPQFQWALFATPKFQGYEITLPHSHPCKGAGVLSTSLRPANFLIDAFFKGSSINVTKPGPWPSAKLFAFTTPLHQVAKFIADKAEQSPEEIISFSANGYSGTMDGHLIPNLGEIYGSKISSFSRKEIKRIVDSQQIFLARYMPLSFYKGLKEAMAQDGIVMLPSCSLEEIRSMHCYLFLNQVAKNPLNYGFQSNKHFSAFKKLSLYSLGAMVVKSQHFHVLANAHGKIIPRSPNASDQIELIDLCGLRDQHVSPLSCTDKQKLMKETFKAALLASGEGLVLFPAVGMGVWGGDPAIYWNALCKAIEETDVPLKWIGVNPGHAPTPRGKYKGKTGSEFQEVLTEHIKAAKLRKDFHSLARLRKVYNLQRSGKDIVQLARSLKLRYPEWKVSLINASDPDVTLGNHVGEYTNVISRKCTTTEENYTALGTNAFCFEGITQIQNKANQIFQT